MEEGCVEAGGRGAGEVEGVGATVGGGGGGEEWVEAEGVGEAVRAVEGEGEEEGGGEATVGGGEQEEE